MRYRVVGTPIFVNNCHCKQCQQQTGSTSVVNAMYEGVYPLATALGRPLIAKLLVDAAREEGATTVAHGCTGKGNDQVRFDLAVKSSGDYRIVAPVREIQKEHAQTRAYEQVYL